MSNQLKEKMLSYPEEIRRLSFCNWKWEKRDENNVDRFLALVRKYTDVRELNAEIIREFVEKIYVHQTERINGKKVQHIRIIWNCIGEFTPPIAADKEKTA